MTYAQQIYDATPISIDKVKAMNIPHLKSVLCKARKSGHLLRSGDVLYKSGPRPPDNRGKGRAKSPNRADILCAELTDFLMGPRRGA